MAFAYHHKKFTDRHLYAELGELILDEKAGREGNEIIYFNAVGLAALDLYLGRRLLDVALAKGDVGLSLMLSDDPLWILGTA